MLLNPLFIVINPVFRETLFLKNNFYKNSIGRSPPPYALGAIAIYNIA